MSAMRLSKLFSYTLLGHKWSAPLFLMGQITFLYLSWATWIHRRQHNNKNASASSIFLRDAALSFWLWYLYKFFVWRFYDYFHRHFHTSFLKIQEAYPGVLETSECLLLKGIITKGKSEIFILVYFSSRLSPFISLEKKSFHIDCSASATTAAFPFSFFRVPTDLFFGNRTCHQKCDCSSSSSSRVIIFIL